MNVLDENIGEYHRDRLLDWGLRARQIGYDVGRAGMSDQEILTLLHRIRRTTFFSRDEDFADPRLCHPAYCIVFLTIRPRDTAEYVRRVLRHPALNTQAKRMGAYVRAGYDGPRIWRRSEVEQALPWP
jgi:hypothetical protein